MSKEGETSCWFDVPVSMTSRNNPVECIAFLIHHLKENGFLVQHFEPYKLYISWDHWVASYKRQEIRETSGVDVDSYGNVIQKEPSASTTTEEDLPEYQEQSSARRPKFSSEFPSKLESMNHIQNRLYGTNAQHQQPPVAATAKSVRFEQHSDITAPAPSKYTPIEPYAPKRYTETMMHTRPTMQR
jgi:hypothetical protein